LAALLFFPFSVLIRRFQGGKNGTFRDNLHGPFTLLI
jgi:hypothetical protein